MNTKTIIQGLLIGVPVAAIIFVIILFPAPFQFPVHLYLEVPSTLMVDQPAILKAHIKNISSRTVEFDMGGIPAHSFIITDLYGREVWDSRKTQIILLPSAHPRLAPGEAIDLETVIRYENWNPRTDPYFYEPLPSRPGYYFIYAIVDRGQKELDLRSSRQLIKIVK